MHDLHRGIERGVPGSRAIDAAMPFARWADLAALLKDPKRFGFDTANADGKIFLGLLDGQMIGIKDDRHVTLTVGSRGGKTVSVLAPMLLSGPVNRSFVVIDPKLELADLSLPFRAEKLGQWAGIMDPFKRCHPALAGYRVSFNPMSILTRDSDTIAEDAGLLSDAIVMPSGGNDQHWDESAKAIIEGLLLHVATYPAYEGRRSLVTLRHLLMHEMGETLRKEMDKNPAVDGIVQGAASDFFDRADNERAGVLSTTRRHTKFLDYRAMQEALSDPADESKRFRLTDLKTRPEGMSLYVGLPVGRIATSCNRMFRMIVGLTLEAMEREQRRDNETIVLLDEYANAVGPMRSVEVAAGLVAGMGCKLVFVLQGLSQVQNINKDWETLLANSGLQIFYGNSDLTTTEYISKRCGQTTVVVESEGAAPIAQRTDSGAGRSRAPQVTSLITAEEAEKLFARDDPMLRMLVLWSGHEPIVLQRTRYYEDMPFKRLYRRWDG